MLMGQMATFQRFSGEQNLLLPADLDGATPPPTGAPAYFYTFKDDQDHGGADRLEIFELHVDWVNTGNTTFNLVASLPIAPYNYTVCGFFNFNCIRQQNTNQRLDAVSEWPMHRLQYRNFGAYEMLLGNFTVDVTGNDEAGIRWFELRKNTGGQWMLHQEGTHAPDNNSRFMGSIAMDRDGNIALGYTVSSSSMSPTLRYATRIPDDPPGTLQMEVTLQNGGGSQTSNERWGDYSSMNVDPTDDCTFYYTMEYIPAPGADWDTIVGKFRIPECGGAPNGDPCTAPADCQSGFCVDGVCCDTACGAGSTTDCQACSTAAGAGVNGTCSPRPAIECRASAAPCDAAEACDGTSPDCPPDALAPAGTSCRGAADSCDLAEVCDGMAATCPPDVLAPDESTCPGGTCNAGDCIPSDGPKLDPEEEGGCGCRVPGTSTDGSGHTPAAGLALVALGLAGALRRRRHGSPRG
jgi:MYXO-CTERM domain-containing protein